MIGYTKHLPHCLLAWVLLLAQSLPVLCHAQAPTPQPGIRRAPMPPMPGAPVAEESEPMEGEDLYELKFRNAPVDLLLEAYAEATGRTLLKGPGLPTPTITLLGRAGLSREEYLEAILSVLSMHQVGMVPYGERFVKVVPIKSVSRTELDIRQTLERTLTDGEQGALVSQMISLKHIDLTEATKVIEPLRSDFGQAHAFERTNSLLLTDSAANVRRMLEMLRYVDQPFEILEEAIIMPIRHARAEDIKVRLDDIVRQVQEDQKQQSNVPQTKQTGSPTPTVAEPIGVVRARRPIPRPTTASTPDLAPSEATLALAEEAERGVIRGEVKIVADKRTNQLIFITRPSNMAFFEKIIAVLDVETSPDVVVEVIRLEFADAGEVEKMLNDLIGATSREDDPKATTAKGEGVESKPLAEAARQSSQPVQRGESKIGELSKENVKILSDTRTNSLIIMASESDLVALRGIIGDMDIMLSQVLLEVVIIEVQLGRDVSTGVDWVQRSLTAYGVNDQGQKSPKLSFAGGGGGGKTSPTDAGQFATPGSLAGIGGGLSYYLTLFDLNVDVIVRATASDNRSRIISSPVIVTTDNTEATIDVTTTRYFTKGKRQVGSINSSPVYEDDVETKDIGLKLKVTPRINKNGFVVMEIEQSIQNISGNQTVNEQEWPIVANRDLNASIAVSSGETVVLGGLVQESDDENRNMVPLIGEIPVIGRLFRFQQNARTRTEMVVFLTPYVLDGPAAIERETQRRFETLSMKDGETVGWQDSRFPGARAIGSHGGEAAVGPVETQAPEDPAVEEFLRRQEKGWERRMGNN